MIDLTLAEQRETSNVKDKRQSHVSSGSVNSEESTADKKNLTVYSAAVEWLNEDGNTVSDIADDEEAE